MPSSASGGNPNLNKLWGTIVSSVSQRATTAELWQAMRDATADNPEALSGITIQDVNRFRSYAVGIRRATEALAAAPADSVIDASMVAQTPFSAPLQDQALSPTFNVSFQRTFLNEQGIEETMWVTDRFEMALPGTVGDLIQTIGNDMDSQYGGVTTGVSDVSITMG